MSLIRGIFRLAQKGGQHLLGDVAEKAAQKAAQEAAEGAARRGGSEVVENARGGIEYVVDLAGPGGGNGAREIAEEAVEKTVEETLDVAAKKAYENPFFSKQGIIERLKTVPSKAGEYWKKRSGAGKINDGITAYTVGDTVKDVYDAPAHDRGAEAKEAVLMTAASALTAKFKIIPKLLGLSAAGVATSVQGGKVVEDTLTLAPGVDHTTADIWDTNIKHCFTMLIAAVMQVKDGNFSAALDSVGSAFQGAPARGEQAEAAPQGATAQPTPESSQEQNAPSQPQNPRELIDKELVKSMQKAQKEGGTPDYATMGPQRTNEQQLATTGAG